MRRDAIALCLVGAVLAACSRHAVEARSYQTLPGDIVAPGCRGEEVALDDPTPYGSARQALAAVHATGEMFALVDDSGGFFEAFGLGAAPAGKDTATLRFGPSTPRAGKCAGRGSRGWVSFSVPGTVTAVLSRGATLTAGGTLNLTVYSDGPSRGEFIGTSSSAKQREQIVWLLGPDGANPPARRAFLLAGGGNSAWLPAAATTEQKGPPLELGSAFTALSTQPMRCEVFSRPEFAPRRAPTAPAPAPPDPFNGTSPALSVLLLAGPLLGQKGVGRIVVEMTWPGEGPISFSHSLQDAYTFPGYRMSGPGSRKSPLPAPLASWAGCAKSDPQPWDIALQAFPDEHGKLVAEGSLTWGPACDWFVRCSF